MTTLLEMLDQGDTFSLVVLIAILALVGSRMTEDHPVVHSWGRRLAAGAFVAYGLYAGLALQPAGAQDWLHVAFRGLLAAGLALGLSWIWLSVVAFAMRYVLALARASPLPRRNGARRRHEAQELSHEEALLQQAERCAREKREAAQKAEDSRRRDDARLRCLMLYDRHSTALASRFPRERLQEYFDRYMANSSPPEIVEERARTLVALIDEWVAQDKSRQKREFQSLEELAAFFQKQRDEVVRLSYENDVKESFLTNINIQEDQALRRFLSP